MNLELTIEQLAVIDRGLGELPFKDAAPVISAINQQLQRIRKEAADAELARAASKHGQGTPPTD